jgi:flavin reductase (DIM6/NTAB) family NADH-FMN oxidoreductase RutF
MALELAWNDVRTRQFATNVGLITTDGPLGPNIMAAEWTHHISYAPSLLAICIGASAATVANIQTSKEFGVSLAGDDQRVFCSVAGGHTGREVDKIAALTELGATFYSARHINVIMMANAAMNAECRLREMIPLGDHLMFIGDVIHVVGNSAVRPLVYHQGQYWVLGESLVKPTVSEVKRIESVVASHRKPL